MCYLTGFEAPLNKLHTIQVTYELCQGCEDTGYVSIQMWFGSDCIDKLGCDLHKSSVYCQQSLAPARSNSPPSHCTGSLPPTPVLSCHGHIQFCSPFILFPEQYGDGMYFFHTVLCRIIRTIFLPALLPLLLFSE